MIKFLINETLLILIYSPGTPWVIKEFQNEEYVSLKKAFEFSRADVLKMNEGYEEVEFKFGVLDVNGYFRIEGRKLMIKQDVFIHSSVKVKIDFFVAIRNTSIFRLISKVVSEDIYIGGNNMNAISVEDFLNLIKEFPRPFEIMRYVEDRLATVLENYFDSPAKVLGKYTRYMNKKQSTRGEGLPESLQEGEVRKYEALLDKIKRMLQDENKYNEKQWQIEIIEIILLLYPKYIYVFSEAPVYDNYKSKLRKIDFLLVDSNGNVDIIEIKKPMRDKIVTRSQYRDNFIPLRELSGTVMQVEKYIYYLNKSGQAGETKLNNVYQSTLPKDFKIKITNPGGLIIMGREDSLSSEQKEDFEVVKRKYKNVIDIITYDDLIKRLESSILAWENRSIKLIH